MTMKIFFDVQWECSHIHIIIWSAWGSDVENLWPLRHVLLLLVVMSIFRMCMCDHLWREQEKKKKKWCSPGCWAQATRANGEERNERKFVIKSGSRVITINSLVTISPSWAEGRPRRKDDDDGGGNHNTGSNRRIVKKYYRLSLSRRTRYSVLSSFRADLQQEQKILLFFDGTTLLLFQFQVLSNNFYFSLFQQTCEGYVHTFPISFAPVSIVEGSECNQETVNFGRVWMQQRTEPGQTCRKIFLHTFWWLFNRWFQ